MFVTVGYYKIMEIKQTRSEIKIETLQKETSAKGLCSLGTRYLLPLAPFSVKDQRDTNSQSPLPGSTQSPTMVLLVENQAVGKKPCSLWSFFIQGQAKIVF